MDEYWEVGQLVRLKTTWSFTQLHPHFKEASIIWEPINLFWREESNVKDWGIRVDEVSCRVPIGPIEWCRAIKMECAWDLGAKIHQRNMAREILLPPDSMLMVVEVIVTPWKKTYRPARGRRRRKERFSYVKFLASLDDKPIYLYHDISCDWDDLLVNDWVFKVMHK